MELNAIRIIAQLLNLFLLVYLLSRFLFGPITSIMSEREQRIGTRLKQGHQLIDEGQALADQYRQGLDKLQNERNQLLEQAKHEAEQERQELLAQARQEADSAHRHLHDSLEQERDVVRLQFQEEIITHTCQLANRLLTQLAQSELEEQALKLLIDRLEKAETEQVERLKAGLATDPQLVVTTGHPLSSDMHKKLETAILHACQPHRPTIEFTVAKELVFGAAIRTTAASLQWNAADYLRQVEQDSRQELLTEQEATEEVGDADA